ncbi:MAG: glycosyltransferase [Candidatus Delongbacteria bacterium]|nr:glycosyltransferase [Candidatus Delongbacteria bacterium]MBN2835204.1 glycosyltransferase [Candidatus Delongbacteria bacterium]
MRVLLLNYPYLKTELEKICNRILSVGPFPECDLFFDSISLIDIENDLKDFKPDIAIFTNSLDRPRVYSDLNVISCKKIFVSIDSTINFYWMRFYLKNFDMVLCDQPDLSDRFNNEGIRALPFLLACNHKKIIRSSEKRFDISFIGRFNKNVRLKRSNIVNKLQNAGFKINIVDGVQKSVCEDEVYKIYAQSKIVLNENMFPSLNLRLFEIMGSGCVCFTEENDLINTYFKDENLILKYNSSNIIHKLRKILDDEKRIKEISENAQKFIVENHTEEKRAGYLSIIIDEIIKESREEVAYYLDNTLLAMMYLYEKYKFPEYKDYIENNCGKISDTNLKKHLTILGLYNFPPEENDEYYKLWYNILVKNEFGYRHNFDNYSQIMLWSAEKKYKNGEIINPGFTNETSNPMMSSSFEFYNRLIKSNQYKEEALKKIIDILVSIKAFDFALHYAEILKNYNDSFKFKTIYDMLKRESYV